MKVALFHNYLDNIGGAEIVCLTLARALNADVYTTNIDRSKIKTMGFSDVSITSLGKVPLQPPLRQQLALRRFATLRLGQKYDYYITCGDWALSGVLHNKPNMSYIHSPIREIWDLYTYTRQYTVQWYKRWIFDLWVLYNRYLSRKYIAHAQNIVCNSQNTQKRIRTYLKRDATVVHPPIDTSHIKPKKSKGYWLSVNRLITHKRVEMQLEAFSRLPDEKLIIVGSFEKAAHFQEYAKRIKAMKPKNVEIRSFVPFDELCDLYSHCKGFITTSKDEDFGMTPIEAMAAGKPVIAPQDGGYRETVVDGTNGILIPNITSEKLSKAIVSVSSILTKDADHYTKSCVAQAKKFDTTVFVSKMKDLIASSIQS